MIGLAKTIVDKWQREEQGKRTTYPILDRKKDEDDDDDDHDYDYVQDQNYKEFRKDLE